MKAKKPHIVVFFGGEAASRDLSCETGYWVCQYMPREAYDVTPVHVQADGLWQVPLGSLPRGGSVSGMMNYLYRGLKALSPLKALERLAARPITAFFSVLRGRGGDDGGLHSMAYLLKVGVVGSSAAASAQTHNKRMSQALLRDLASVPEASFYAASASGEAVVNDVQGAFEMPVFIKPTTQEASIGTEYVERAEDLGGALERARQFGEIMVQERARGTELTLSFISTGQAKPTVLPPTVVVPRPGGYYDYLAKRRPGRVKLHTQPVDYNTLIWEAEVVARDVYEQLGCQGYASFDLVADGASLDILEVNTVPVLSSATPLLQQLTAAKMHPAVWLESLLKTSL